MKKQADLNSLLGGMGDRLSDASSSLRNMYQHLDPTLKNTLLRSLAGAAVGGTVTGGIAAMTPRDKEDRRGVVGPAMLGALLGGGTAAALPIGMKMLGSGIRFDSEAHKPIGATITDTALKPVLNHPLGIGLPVAAAVTGRNALSKLRYAMTNPLTYDKSKIFDPAGGLVKNVNHSALTRFREALSGPLSKNWWNVERNLSHAPLTGEALKNGVKSIRGGKGRLLAIPAALAAGYIGDKYLKGEY